MSLRDYWLKGPGSRPLLPIEDESAAMRAAEAADPGFVHRNGWTRYSCLSCDEVVYDGRWISKRDLEDLQQLHRIACAGESSS